MYKIYQHFQQSLINCDHLIQAKQDKESLPTRHVYEFSLCLMSYIIFYTYNEL